jgi:MFS family permease
LRLAATSPIFVAMKTRSEVLEESRRKGVRAGAVTAASVALGVVHAPVLAVGAAAAGAWLGWRWWKHRAENGIKF